MPPGRDRPQGRAQQEGQAAMTDDDKPPMRLYGVHARLNPPPHEIEQAVAEYKARQEAEREKMARLKALRLAAGG